MRCRLIISFIRGAGRNLSIGKMSRYEDLEFKQLMKDAERHILKGGKWLSGVTLPGESPVDLFARGYNFVTNSSDLVLLRTAAVKAASKS